MLMLQLALRNILAAGIRTWLNLMILSITLFSIVALQGVYAGMYEQIAKSKIEQELGGSQFWHKNYDPYDPLGLEESHAEIPQSLVERGEGMAPLLIIPAAIYPQGRIQTAVLKGIPSTQSILDLPTEHLHSEVSDPSIPIMLGQRMAKQTRLEVGDVLTARWRTVEGAFEALDFSVVKIFETVVPSMDQGVIWLDFEMLNGLVQSENHATVVVLEQGQETPIEHSEWVYWSQDELLTETKKLVQSKSIGGSIFYGLLLFLAMIAIFDTQALSVFRRKKEIGTLMALGMTPSMVQSIFLWEGVLQGFLATGLAALYGVPVLWYLSVKGIVFPVSGEEFGIALSNVLFPHYSVSLVLGTLVWVLVLLIVVSYWPARHITKMLPCDALRGK